MAILTISGEPASRWEEVAHTVSQLPGFKLVTETGLSQWMASEFGATGFTRPCVAVPAALSTLARMAAEHHLVVAIPPTDVPSLHRKTAARQHCGSGESRRARPDAFDLVLNAETMSAVQMAGILRAAINTSDWISYRLRLQHGFSFNRLQLARTESCPSRALRQARRLWPS